MKHLLAKGTTELLIPERYGGGLTGEVHTLTYDDTRYVLRKCPTLKKARFYEDVSQRFEEHGFLPEFLGRQGKNVFFEYIEGRDLYRHDRLKYFSQVGNILSTLNSIEFKGRFHYPLEVYLQELETGIYKTIGKVALARERRNIIGPQPFKLPRETRQDIERIIRKLRRETRPKVVYDCTDPTPSNFRLRDGKIYLVDIDSIKPSYQGAGVAKFFLRWGKSKAKQEQFIKGYGKKEFSFYQGSYKDFLNLNFLVKRLWFSVQTNKEYKGSTLSPINEILKRYNHK